MIKREEGGCRPLFNMPFYFKYFFLIFSGSSNGDTWEHEMVQIF